MASQEAYELLAQRLNTLLKPSTTDTALSVQTIKDVTALLQQSLNQLKVDQCYDGCVVQGDHNPFKAPSEVINLQNDPNKIRIGQNCDLWGELMVLRTGGEIVIGDHTYMGEFNKIWSNAKVTLGNNIMTSHHVYIVDSDFHEMDSDLRVKNFAGSVSNNVDSMASTDHIPKSPVVIEDKVWINFNVSIYKGVTIGEGSVIASNAVVNKDIPPYSLAVGNPARVIKKLS